MAKDDKQDASATSPATPPAPAADGGAMLNEIQRQASLARASGEAQVALEKAEHVVASGLSVSTVRGIVGEGQPVTVQDFAFSGSFHAKPADAQRDFAELLARGAIVRGG